MIIADINTINYVAIYYILMTTLIVSNLLNNLIYRTHNDQCIYLKYSN